MSDGLVDGVYLSLRWIDGPERKVAAGRFLADWSAAQQPAPHATAHEIEAACQSGMTKEWLTTRYGIGFAQMLAAYLSGNATLEELTEIRRRYGLEWTSRTVLRHRFEKALTDLHAYYGDH